jgi:drug/metabolite transporter (DMT)-like permease
MSLALEGAAHGNKEIWKGFGFALVAVILWSGNFIVARALSGRIPPVSLAFLRWSVATLLLLPIAYGKLRRDWPLLRRHLPYLSVAALCGVTLFNTFIYIAGRYSPAMNLALIGNTAAPVFVLILGGIFLKQRISVYQVAGALFCISGIILLISRGSMERLRAFHFSAGDGWILLAALSFSIYTLLVRRKPQELSATSFLFALFFLGTCFLLPAFLFDVRNGITFQVNQQLAGIILYLGAGASVTSFLCWNKAIRFLGPARTSLFGNLTPVFSSIEAALILNEAFTWVTVASFVMVLAGIGIANRKSKRSG